MDARLSSAEIAGSSPARSAVHPARPWWLLAADPGFQPGPHGFDPRPRHYATYSPPWSSGQDAWFSARRSPVRIRLGVRSASTTGGEDRCPGLLCTQARRGSIPRRSTQRLANEAHVDARLLAMQEVAGSRPVIRSTPAWRKQVYARSSDLRVFGHPGSTPGAGTQQHGITQRVVGKRPSHLLWEQGTVGSSPTCPTHQCSMAQSAERRPVKAKGPGSSPGRAASTTMRGGLLAGHLGSEPRLRRFDSYPRSCASPLRRSTAPAGRTRANPTHRRR